MVNWWESEEYESKLKKLREESERLKEERLKKERRALKERPEPSREKGKSASNKPVVDLTDATFTEAVQNHPLVVVDCWAPWCQPCLFVSPVVEEIAQDYVGRIFFGKLNVDNNRNIAVQHQIMSIPTLLVFKNGKLVDQIIGAMPRKMLEPKIIQHL